MSAADKRAVDIPLQDGELVSAATANSTRSLPPCGGGLGRGVARFAAAAMASISTPTPTPDPSPQGGGEQTELEAPWSSTHSHVSQIALPPNDAWAAPEAQGLYDPALEKDSCGVGFIADIKGRSSHKLIEDALAILCNLEHRGAVGADPRAGDGAGILVQIPHRFFAKKADRLGFDLPRPGEYAVGVLFMPRDPDWRQIIRDIYAQMIKREGMTLLGWREVPTDNSTLGELVKPTEPVHLQVFIGRGRKIRSEDEFERRLYVLRKSISNAIYTRKERRLSGYYPVSISCRTVVYKGMFLADQLGTYYPDLHDPDFASALALVHQRFSTNTFPTWSLAHPYRMVAHNGEINTLRGNVNWMAARQASVSSHLFGDDINKLWPISYEGQSDTACFDNALEFLVQGGYPLAHAMMMMIPEAWAGNPLMDEERRAFYEYNAALMEPWDGPAAIAFTNGRQIGATLDRNGLRPARYFVTRDERIIMASEMGVLPIAEKDIVQKWRLQPGKMLLVDLDQGRLIPDEELKATLANSHPYKEWLERTQIVLEDLPPAPEQAPLSNFALLDRQQAFGYSQEDLRLLMSPMAVAGEEAVGSMGNDTPISALSSKPKLLFTYFKQNFAQVTNPPIDPIREELVMSLVSIIGPRPNLFDVEGASHLKRLECASRSSPMRIWKRSARCPRPAAAISARASSTPPGRPSREPRGSRTRSRPYARAPRPRCAKASTSSSSRIGARA